jgi:hypothetical protein
MADSVKISTANTSSYGYVGKDSVTGLNVYITGYDANGNKELLKSPNEPTEAQTSLWESVHPGSDPDNSYYDIQTGELTTAPLPVPPAPDPATTPTGDEPEATTDQEQQNIANASSTGDAVATTTVTNTYTPSAADNATPAANVSVGGNQSSNTAGVSSNPLDAYTSYTYGLTLFALSKTDYNTLVDTPTSFTPNVALISSAGRYKDIRDPNFTEDFYFDSFKVSTIIGMNANARGSNAIALDFTIIEPYGMTLLDRIMNVSLNNLAAKNYLDIPYLLRLEFFGYDDSGKAVKIQNQTKNFPIKLINFKIKASVKGSEYTVQAVPFNHTANLESVQAIKTRMEITASTVSDFFAPASEPSVQQDVDSFRDTQAESQAYSSGQAGGGSLRGQARDPRILGQVAASDSAQVSLKLQSFTSAYNAWNKSSKNTNDVKFADQISFNIDPDIGGSKIVDPKTNTAKRTGETSVKKESQAQQGQDSNTLDLGSVVHSFEAGTSVNEIINAIIPNSQFFLSQIKDSNTDSKTPVNANAADDATVQAQATPVYMWKVIPKIKLTEFDTERNVWGKTIEFNIKKYKAYQQRDPRLPKSPPPKPVKRYDYFYTGHNSAVINFDIDFNALYFTAVQIDRSNTESTAGTTAKPEDTNKDGTTTVGGKSGLNAAEQKVNTGSQMQTGTGGSNNRSATQNAKSALESIYTSAAGDMLNLKMQIIGDPHFIKQDDLFIVPDVTPPLASDASSVFVASNVQSLNMDDGEIYCYVTFKTPTDFNDTTGMYNLNGANKFHTSEFSGYYRVIQVDSEFKGGKFTQTLNMIRYPMQDSPNTNPAQNPVGLDANRNDKATAPTTPSDNSANATTNADTPAQAAPNANAGADNDAASSTEQAPDQNAVTQTDSQPTPAEDALANVANNAPTVDIADLASSQALAETNYPQSLIA